jgi:hypothetical protein
MPKAAWRKLMQLGLEGEARDKAIAAMNGLSAATYNNVNAQQAAAANGQAEAADLGGAESLMPLLRDAEMAAQGITEWVFRSRTLSTTRRPLLRN